MNGQTEPTNIDFSIKELNPLAIACHRPPMPAIWRAPQTTQPGNTVNPAGKLGADDCRRCPTAVDCCRHLQCLQLPQSESEREAGREKRRCNVVSIAAFSALGPGCELGKKRARAQGRQGTVMAGSMTLAELGLGEEIS